MEVRWPEPSAVFGYEDVEAGVAVLSRAARGKWRCGILKIKNPSSQSETGVHRSSTGATLCSINT
jgi:hypothetical protein